MRSVTRLLLVASLILATAGASHAVQYRMRNVGSPDGLHATPYAINDNGQVVGTLSPIECALKGFVWDEANGLRTPDPLPGHDFSFFADINNSGQIAGVSYLSENNKACIWSPSGDVLQLEAIPGLQVSEARAINSQGLIAGSATSGDWSRNMMVVWDSSGRIVSILDTGYRGVTAAAITERGWVAGCYGDASFAHAYIWDSINGFRDIGVLGGSHGQAEGINEAGQVVGTSSTNDSVLSRAFIWDSANGMQELGLPKDRYSAAHAINNKGQVVGVCGNDAFVWDPVDGVQILEGFEAYAWDINDRGQIVGESGGKAVIWEPVPEPASIASVLMGLGGLGMLRRKALRRRS